MELRRSYRVPGIRVFEQICKFLRDFHGSCDRSLSINCRHPVDDTVQGILRRRCFDSNGERNNKQGKSQKISNKCSISIYLPNFEYLSIKE